MKELHTIEYIFIAKGSPYLHRKVYSYLNNVVNEMVNDKQFIKLDRLELVKKQIEEKNKDKNKKFFIEDDDGEY